MIDTIMERFNSLSAREKIISLLTLLIMVWGAWDKFIYQPLAIQQKLLGTELSSIKTELSANRQIATQIEASAKIDPNTANREKLKKIKAELKNLKLQLNAGDKQFVPPHQVTEVLQNILKQNSGLKLISLESLPVTTLTETKQQKSWIYRHGLSMTLSGSYFNTLNYLKSMESLPWRFNWESVDYQVKEYPIAETTLRVYTLSFEENWLGL